MTLDDFKRIFWYEYAHRQIGRVIGVAFAGPALYFIARGRVNAPLRNRLLLIGACIGGQVFFFSRWKCYLVIADASALCRRDCSGGIW